MRRELRAKARATAIAAALGFLLAAFASSAAAPWPLTPAAERMEAPDFSLPGLAGERWRLKEAKGRPLLLNFAATWCPPCLDELPSLARLHDRQGREGLQVVTVFVDRAGRAEVAPLAEELSLPFPVLLDPEGLVKRVFLVRALPTTVLIDPEGRLAGRFVGALAWDEPEARSLLAALAEKPPAE